MRIPELVIFAYATRGEALEVANHTTEETCVAGVSILVNGRGQPKRGGKNLYAEVPVCYIVVPKKNYPFT